MPFRFHPSGLLRLSVHIAFLLGTTGGINDPQFRQFSERAEK
jgi:hypothetical protein